MTPLGQSSASVATDHPTVRFNNTYLWTISLAAALGGLLFGYDWVVIGGAKPFYETYFRLTDPSQQGWAMSCALIGCLVGAMISGTLCDRYGRKRLLILSALLFAISSLAIATTKTFNMFVAWRIAGGIAIGLASNLSPMYIAEVAPARVRGKLVSVNQLTIVIGILLAQVMNWVIAKPVAAGASATDILNSWNGQLGWRWMFGVTALPSVLFFLSMIVVPESPRWLARKGQVERARKVLERLGGAHYAETTLKEIEGTLSADPSGGLRQLLDPRLAGVLLLGITLAVFQQWCGINVIFNYAADVFAASGYNVSDALLNIVITGAVNLAFTFVAMALVDRSGRRKLMLFGSAALAVIYTLLGIGFHQHGQGLYMLLLVVAAIACYAMSLAPVTWVVISEIFPNRIRGAAMSAATTSLWIASFVLTYTFPLLNRGLGAARTFWIYGAICLAGFIYILLRLPETRGRTLEEIEQSLVR